MLVTCRQALLSRWANSIVNDTGAVILRPSSIMAAECKNTWHSLFRPCRSRKYCIPRIMTRCSVSVSADRLPHLSVPVARELRSKNISGLLQFPFCSSKGYTYRSSVRWANLFGSDTVASGQSLTNLQMLGYSFTMQRCRSLHRRRTAVATSSVLPFLKSEDRSQSAWVKSLALNLERL